MLHIRPFQPPDTDALRDILNEIVARGDAFLYDTSFTTTSTQVWVGTHTAVFIAEDAGRMVGGYALRPNQPGRGSHICNAAYMVAESARGKGAGRALGEHSLEEAKRLGFTAMQFNAVVSTNTHAVALWQSLGFRITGTLPAAFRLAGDRFADLHVMFREL